MILRWGAGVPEFRQGAKLGYLLIGHGTQDRGGQAEFFAAARQVAAALAPTPVESAFLELAEPDIRTGMQRLVAQGVEQVIAAPALLFAAGHAKQDIPEALAAALAELSARLPADANRQIRCWQAEPLGCHPRLIAWSAELVRQCLMGAGRTDPQVTSTPWEQTTLVMVGRGSSDPEATGETVRFARLVAELLGIARFETGFVAVARPSLPEALAAAAASNPRTIVVVPHLLFQGSLLRTVAEQVSRVQSEHDSIAWHLASHLGPSPAVVAALVDRCREARQQAT